MSEQLGRSGAGVLTLGRMRADVAAVLEVPAADVGDDDDLLDFGLDSVRLMVLAQRWRAAGAAVDFPGLAERPRLRDWWALVARAAARGADSV